MKVYRTIDDLLAEADRLQERAARSTGTVAERYQHRADKFYRRAQQARDNQTNETTTRESEDR